MKFTNTVLTYLLQNHLFIEGCLWVGPLIYCSFIRIEGVLMVALWSCLRYRSALCNFNYCSFALFTTAELKSHFKLSINFESWFSDQTFGNFGHLQSPNWININRIVRQGAPLNLVVAMCPGVVIEKIDPCRCSCLLSYVFIDRFSSEP
jgi:hypothetical protein